MTSEEYIQVIEKLMELQDKNVNWLLTVLGILLTLIIGLAAFYQWRLSKGDKESLRNEMDAKDVELERRIEKQLYDLDKEIRNNFNDYENQIKDLKIKYENSFLNLEEKLSVKEGSNVNGYWVRYPDGNQICRHTINIKRDKFQEDIGWVYPASFYDKDIAVFTEVEDTNKVRVKKIIKEEFQTIILLDKLDTFSEVGDTRINLIAYGKWNKKQTE